MTRLKNVNVLILATDGFEESELTEPRGALQEAGATVKIASLEKGEIRAWQSGQWSETVAVDLTIDEVDVHDFAALVLPGGVINPDMLRREAAVVDLIRSFNMEGRIIAAICHAPWLLAEANLLKGRKVTSYWSIRTDIENAGGLWVEEEVVLDAGIVTSRSPDDLPAFNGKLVEQVVRWHDDHAEAA